MPDSFAESADGLILVANGIDPVVRWDGRADQAEPAGVAPPSTAVTLAGSGAGSITGAYAAYARFVDRNGNYSDLSPVSGEVTLSGAAAVVYTGVPVSAQPSVVRRQVLRNTAGQMSVFYVDVDTTELSSTTVTSTYTDGQLAAQEAVPLLGDEGTPAANVYGVPPATKPFLAYHLQRMFLAGERPYAEGSVAVTRGSTAVAGVATEWPATFVGRFLYVQGAARAYEVDAVDTAAQTLTLVEPYADDTDPFAEYAIKPSPGEASLLYYSEPGLPEAWPPTNALSLPEDGDAVTGMRAFGSFLYIFKRRRTYRLTAQSDPGVDGFLFHALGRGCVNHRAPVVVEEQMYVLDEGGVYRTGGGDQAEQLSTPIQNLFRPDEAGAINWTAARYFHCSFDSRGETVRWFVTMRGDYLPRHALCLHYPSGKWWVEEFPEPVPASVTGRLGRPTGGWGDGEEAVFLGSSAGAVLVLAGPLDGVLADGPTTRGGVTAAGSDTLTDSAAAFDTGWANVPVCLTEGRGAGQLRRVVAATATTLTVDEPWATLPDATTRYQVGGIRFRLGTGRTRWAPSEKGTGRSVEVLHVPTPLPQVLNLRVFDDFLAGPRRHGREVGRGQRHGVRAAADGTDIVVDLSQGTGLSWHRLDGHRELGVDARKLVRFEIDGVSGPAPVVLGEVVFNGMVR